MKRPRRTPPTPTSSSRTALVLCTIAGLAATTHAQIHFEVEPNETKAQALANGPFLLQPGTQLVGTTTGSSTAAGPTSVDTWLLQVAPAAPGIYRHRLTISTPGTAGHIGTIRGLSQSSGVINTTSDSAAQTTATTVAGSVPIRTNQWYGFGKGEQLYYRVTGNTNTTAQYTATFSTDVITPVDIGAFQAGTITITTLAQGHTSATDLWIYDNNLNAIPGYGNDDSPAPATGLQSTLTRDFTAGTYYMALSRENLANNQPAPPDDRWRSATVLDFADAVLCSASTNPTPLNFAVSDAMGTTQFPATSTDGYQVQWYVFTVSGTVTTGACCFDDGTCSELTSSQCTAQSGTYAGDNTTCATTVCAQPGACCLSNGTCQTLGPVACATAGGVFSGHGTTCATTPCPQPGACCLPSGHCNVMLAAQCSAVGGAYGGDNSLCAVACPPPTNKLIPPSFQAPGASWAYSPDYSQSLTGGFNANAVRLIATAAPALPGAWQNDARMDLIAPNGSTLSIGSSGAVAWTAPGIFLSGVGPAGSANAQSIDAIYLWNFGPIDGEWKVNFRNNWSSGSINWSQIEVIPLQLAEGACCFASGCEIRMESACTALGGVYGGDNSACEVACAATGACCLPNMCIAVTSTACTTLGGTYLGDNTPCAAGACPDLLASGGGIITEMGVGLNGSNISRASAADNTAGVAAQLNLAGPSFRLAEDFIVADPEGWKVNEVVIYGYITGTASNPYTFPPVSPFTGASLQIWDGIPGAMGSTIVASSNALLETGWTGVHRIFNADPATGAFRPLMFIRVGLADVELPTGTYWLDYQIAGALGATTAAWTPLAMQSPSVPPRDLLGNSRQLTPDGWVASTRSLPFAVKGMVLEPTPTCYANCDGSTSAPVLNVDDFTCFINAFAGALALPPAQQIEHYANCDGSTLSPVLNVDDFTCFINKFAQGCP